MHSSSGEDGKVIIGISLKIMINQSLWYFTIIIIMTVVKKWLILKVWLELFFKVFFTLKYIKIIFFLKKYF